jgi:hypothetical protein
METPVPAWDLLGIYFGIIAFFGGLVIPLYYGLAVNLIEEITRRDGGDGNKDPQPHARRILWYVWTSDFIVFGMGLLGVAGILVGALIVCYYCRVSGDQFCRNNIGGVVLCYCVALSFFALLAAFWRTCQHRKKGHARWQFVLFWFLVLVPPVAAWFWWRPLLINDLRGSPGTNWAEPAMVHVLFGLAFLYLLWLLLAAVYFPMTSLYELKRRQGDP